MTESVKVQVKVFHDAHTGIPSHECEKLKLKLTLTQQLARALARERMKEADDGTDQ
jgi:hypothetical protein